MLTILIATTNAHKKEEIQSLFKGYDVTFISLKDLNIDIDVEENGKTYMENAIIKVKEYSKYTSLPIIADDSGIEIDALGDKFPGIYSARYQKANGGDKVLNEKLVKTCTNSKAKFTSAIAFKYGDKIYKFEGIVKGKISEKVIGEHGFGYDPIFYYHPYRTTLGNVSEEKKNKVSHRYKAIEKLKSFLIENKLI